jgi:hypothetical protein
MLLKGPGVNVLTMSNNTTNLEETDDQVSRPATGI